MKLVIGGYAQGKLKFVLNRYGAENCVVLDGCLLDENRQQELSVAEKTMVVNHFHRWVKEQLLQKKNPEAEISAFIIKNPECVIISDEIGNGIVPADAFERSYREQTGRILVKLAGEADEVVRVLCGIGQKIK